MIIDTHIHLNDEKYRENFSQIIKEAKAAGVGKMIVVGYDYESSRWAIDLAERYDYLYAAVGLHPGEAPKENDRRLHWLRRLLTHPRVVAIGEIGLDYHWDKTYADLQKEYFVTQIAMANESGLPVIIHSRDAASDTAAILYDNAVPGVLHCYSMGAEMAKEFVHRGYYLGIGGVLTFKNSRELRRVVKETALEHLLSETDGPYLAPEPYRGRLNKPSYLKYVIEKIAEIKELAPEAVISALRRNAQRLFKI